MSGPRKVRGKDIASKVRLGFDKAIEDLKKGGTITDISDIFQEMIAQDPFKAFDTLAKYVPKEMMIQQDVTHRIIQGDAIDAEQWEVLNDIPEAIEDRTH